MEYYVCYLVDCTCNKHSQLGVVVTLVAIDQPVSFQAAFVDFETFVAAVAAS